jgi:hypothetical protein
MISSMCRSRERMSITTTCAATRTRVPLGQRIAAERGFESGDRERGEGGEEESGARGSTASSTGG